MYTAFLNCKHFHNCAFRSQHFPQDIPLRMKLTVSYFELHSSISECCSPQLCALVSAFQESAIHMTCINDQYVLTNLT